MCIFPLFDLSVYEISVYKNRQMIVKGIWNLSGVSMKIDEIVIPKILRFQWYVIKV